MLITIFQNDLATDMGVMDERDFARFEFKIRFRWISYMAKPQGLLHWDRGNHMAGPMPGEQLSSMFCISMEQAIWTYVHISNIFYMANQFSSFASHVCVALRSIEDCCGIISNLFSPRYILLHKYCSLTFSFVSMHCGRNKKPRHFANGIIKCIVIHVYHYNFCSIPSNYVSNFMGLGTSFVP